MQWQAPEFTEIEMNAEIGAYTRDPEPANDPVAAALGTHAHATEPRGVPGQPDTEAASSRG